MPPLGERPPIPDERRLAVSQWIEYSVRPVAQVIAEETIGGEVTAQPFETRDHQIEGWDALWCARAQGAGRALVHLATGGGKTTLSAVDLMKYREECALMSPPVMPRALYVSHKREINDQAAQTMRRFMPDLEEHFFETRKAHKRPEVDITYAPIQSLYSKLDTFDPDEFEYIIWDEAHHLPAETYNKVLEYFNPLFEYALTATPDRADGKDIRDYFGEAIFSKGLAEGIAEGWLAEVDYHIVFDKAMKDEVKAGFDPKTMKEIKELFEKKASPEVLAKNIREEIDKLGLDDPKTMIFCESIEEADEMADLLGGVSYHSGTKDRPEVLKDFKQGKKRIITTKDMFNEGVDVPDAEVVIFLRATESDAIFLQQLGRGLRKIPGKDKLYVLDFVANVERVAKIRELSKAIQKRAHELGDAEVSEKHLKGDDPECEGLRVHSRHGDFDFDSVAMDLLEKLDALKPTNFKSQFAHLSNDEIVKLALQIKPDGPLMLREVGLLSKNKDFVSGNHIIRRFGSFTNFQRACGFDVAETKRRNTKDMSKDEIIALAVELQPESPLSIDEVNQLGDTADFPSPYTIRQKFGSWAAFQEACGFEVQSNLTNDQLVKLALEISPDKPLSSPEIIELRKKGIFPNSSTITFKFGSIRKFQEACGFKPRNFGSLTNAEIVAIAKELKPNEKLSRQEISELSEEGSFVSATTIKQRFGGMTKFYEACGFASHTTKLESMTNDELIALALELKPEGALTASEISDFSKAKKFGSYNFIAKRFGSKAVFDAACEAARANKDDD